MDNQNRKLELLGNAPIPKALLAMGIPTMIGSSSTPCTILLMPIL